MAAKMAPAIAPYLWIVTSFMFKDLNVAVTTNIAVRRYSKQVRHAIAHLAIAIATHAHLQAKPSIS